MLLSKTKELFNNDVFYNHITKDLEAINFQVNSGFPRELEAIFDKAFEFIKIYDEKYGEVSDSDKAAIKYEKFKKFFEKELNPLIINTVKKHTGIVVEKIELSTPHNFEGVFGLAVMTQAPSDEEWYELYNVAAKYSGYKDIDISITEYTEKLMKMSASFDRVKGMILANGTIKVTLFIPLGFFSLKDMNDNGIEFTSKEITSMFLHEIGHQMVMYEYMNDAAYVGYYGNNMLRDVVTANVKKDPKKAIQDTLTLIKNRSTTVKNKAHVKILNSLSITLNKLNDYVSDPIEISEDKKKEYEANVVSTIIIRIISFCIMIGISILFISFAFILPSDEMTSMLEYFDKNNSRDIITTKNDTIDERLADEYVSRFGMSKDLNSSLLKLTMLRKIVDKKAFDKPIFNKTIRNSTFLYIINKILVAPGNLLSYVWRIKEDGFHSTYEEDLTRLKRNINNLHDVIKGNIPRDIKEKLIDDIESMEYQLNQSKKDLSINAIEKALKFTLNVIPNRLENIRDIFVKNNPYKEYELVFEYIDDMLSNKSYYHSERIKSLFR